MKIFPEKWKPCDGIILEDAADEAVRCSNNHVLVVAGPGAGKTELLAQKAAFLFQTNNCKAPQKILAISFKTDAAQNLKERVEQRCGEEIKGRFASMTYDAFAKSILDHFLFAIPDELRPASDYLVNDTNIIDAAFKKVGYNNPKGLSSSKLKSEYDRILSQTDVSISDHEIQCKVWSLLLQGFDGNKSTLTFKMIMKLAMFIVKTNPYIKRALQMTYSYIFLDEFQDTTGIQYSFVKECFWGADAKVTAVGDGKQRIMVWAGAKKTIFDDFCNELNPKKVNLLMNHRSAPRLVALQKEMYASLKQDPTEIVVSDKWSEHDGDIALIIADDEQKESQAITENVLKQICRGTNLKDICILCKQLPQNYASAIIDGLKEKGIRARVENEYQDLIKEPIVDLLTKFMMCAKDRKHPNEWAFVVQTIAELWGIEEQQDDDAYYEMLQGLTTLADTIQEKIAQKMDVVQWHNILESILKFVQVAKVKAKFPPYMQGEYFDEIIKMFENKFWNEYELSDCDWSLAIENFCGYHSIPIMTIHKSKGLEYTAVYFVGLEDSAFWNFRQQPEEDRCAFFVALSRAKESITFTFCKQRNNLKYPIQHHTEINEFFELLQQPGVAKVINAE